MDDRNLVESLLRWLHVGAGILWMGHLWFFNWVNAGFTAALDPETKRKVVPELMPRALWMFRWGAIVTWLSGFILLGLVYHATGIQFADPLSGNPMAGGIMTLVALLAFGVYEPVAKRVPSPAVHLVFGLVGTALLVWLFTAVGGFGWRGTAIHLGTAYGTIMAANVWMRIWPAQRRIIAAVKAGETPDPALVATSALRSKHNAYLSVPLIFTMLAQHATWGASYAWSLPAVVLVGWGCVWWMYRKAATLKGF